MPKILSLGSLLFEASVARLVIFVRKGRVNVLGLAVTLTCRHPGVYWFTLLD